MDLFLSLRSVADVGLLVLRLALALTFWGHGVQKLSLWKKAPSDQMPGRLRRIMLALSIIEPVTAVALAAGFLTQIFAVLVCIDMFGAIGVKTKIWKLPPVGSPRNSWLGWDTDFMNLAGGLILVLLGAGAFSLDRILFGA